MSNVPAPESFACLGLYSSWAENSALFSKTWEVESEKAFNYSNSFPLLTVGATTSAQMIQSILLWLTQQRTICTTHSWKRKQTSVSCSSGCLLFICCACLLTDSHAQTHKPLPASSANRGYGSRKALFLGFQKYDIHIWCSAKNVWKLYKWLNIELMKLCSS